MARYRNIHCMIWNDDKFPFVSDDCKLVFFHLLTTPYSSPFGLYKASIGALSDEMRWPQKRYEKAFREGFQNGFFRYDERHHVILLPRFLNHNPPNNPNVLISWSPMVDELPDSDLKAEWFDILKDLVKGFGEGFQKALGKAFPKGYAYTGAGAGAVSGAEYPPLTPPLGGPASNGQIPYLEIIEYLNKQTGHAYRDTDDTKKLIRRWWTQGFRVDDFKQAIDKMTIKWIHDPKMSIYLRPPTLFGSKFESYVNAPVTIRDKTQGVVSDKSIGPLQWLEMHERNDELCDEVAQ